MTIADKTTDLEDSAHAAARMLKLLASEQRLLLLCRNLRVFLLLERR